MLLSDAIVSSQHFLFEVAVTAKTGCSNLAAGMVLAVVPVHIACSAMVICMQELMRQGVIDLFLTQEMIVAKYHPIRWPKTTTSLGVTVLHLEKAFVHLTSSLLHLVDHEFDSGVPVEGMLQHLVAL